MAEERLTIADEWTTGNMADAADGMQWRLVRTGSADGDYLECQPPAGPGWSSARRLWGDEAYYRVAFHVLAARLAAVRAEADHLRQSTGRVPGPIVIGPPGTDPGEAKLDRYSRLRRIYHELHDLAATNGWWPLDGLRAELEEVTRG